MKNSTFLLIAIVVFGILISNIQLGKGQASPLVNGIINIDSASDPIPEPSVPEFALRFFETPFISPPSTWINPFTGKNETLSQGFYGETRSIEITVKNQPFSPHSDSNGNLINVYYNVSFKGHYSDSWAHYPDSTNMDLFNASASDYTVIQMSLGNYPSIPDNSQLDFRLEALIGHYDYDHAPSGIEYITGFSALETSGWSNTQTIIISQGDSTATPNAPSYQNSMASPSSELGHRNAALFGSSWGDTFIVILLSVIAVLLFGIFASQLKRSNRHPS